MYQLFTRNQMTSNGKPGMRDLMKVVLDLKRDVKRINSIITPQGAQKLIDKHNQANPSSPWTLWKRNPNGAATIENMPDVNADGIPDVIIRDKNNIPVYANGYTTVQSDWPNTLGYHLAYPDKESRAAYKQQHGKSITKRDFVNQTLGVTHFGYDDATSPELLRQIGAVTGDRVANTPQWYQNALNDPKSGYRMKKPRKQSAYEMFNKYIFGPVFNDAVATIEDAHRTQIPGQLKIQIRAKLAGHYWKHQVKIALGVPDDMPDAEFDKLRRKKSSQSSIENRVYEVMGDFKNSAETHSYDELYERLVADLRSALRLPTPIGGGGESPADHARSFMTNRNPLSGYGAQPSQEEYEAYANSRLAQEGPDLEPAELANYIPDDNANDAQPPVGSFGPDW